GGVARPRPAAWFPALAVLLILVASFVVIEASHAQGYGYGPIDNHDEGVYVISAQPMLAGYHIRVLICQSDTHTPDLLTEPAGFDRFRWVFRAGWAARQWGPWIGPGVGALRAIAGLHRCLHT